ncbi:hypothetical protein [Clostridium perfringens]|uniref:hypothetical protein n=1 Tax=Clostridium perfringens TaxID=1502 RepID=UPI00234110DF|nr:hypothetical protein [Clostridium perfringens]MDC4245562.1 hypothetical protein [Clostridium perfringens]
MKNYKVIYREKGNKKGQLYETMSSADNLKEAKRFSKLDLVDYTIVSIKLDR